MNPIDLYYCSTSTPTLLHFFNWSYAPPLLYYSYIPVIILSLLLGFFIYKKDKYSTRSKYLFLFSITFVLWVLNIIFQWVIVYAQISMFLWQITALIEVLIPIFVFYFYYSFVYNKKLPKYIDYITYMVIAFVAVLLSTRYNMSSFDTSQCQANIGVLLHALAGLEIFTCIVIAILCGIYCFSKKYVVVQKRQTLLLAVGSVAFLLTFSISNIVGFVTNIYQFNLYGPIGMVVFLILLTFMIVRYKTFNMKTFSAQVLIFALIALIGSELFLLQSVANIIIVAVTLIITGFIGINLMRSVKKEITLREQIEKQKNELEIANKKLEAFDVLKSKFLSLASHQLRNPISAIIYCTSMFLDGSFGEISELQKKMLSQMFQGAQDMEEDIEKYLTLAKIDQSGLQYNLKELDMADLVGSMTERQKLVAKNKGLDLSFETDGNSPYLVNGDKIQLKQVVQNLIDNAMKFTKEGWIKVNLSKDQAAKKIRLVVSDSGRGIKPEIIPTLFKEFSRGDGAQVDVGGSGIGIYAAKEIVENGHGGKIWVESDGEGKGSSFIVEIPEILSK